jgi:hypothetical protein
VRIDEVEEWLLDGRSERRRRGRSFDGAILDGARAGNEDAQTDGADERTHAPILPETRALVS